MSLEQKKLINQFISEFGFDPFAQQGAQTVPTQRQYEMALRQWDHWKSYALELQAKLVKYEGGSPMVLNAAPTLPAQRVTLTDDEIDFEIQLHIDPVATYRKLHNFARAVIEAYERKNGIEVGRNVQGKQS